MKYNKAIRYRIYPNQVQAEFFRKTFDCRRNIWNKILEDTIKHREETGKILKTTPAKYKEKYPYLKDADSLALANTNLDLQAAIKKYFAEDNVGFPNFKSAKKAKRSYRTNNQQGSIAIEGQSIKLPKAKKVKAKIHRKPNKEWKLKSATITQEKDNKYYVSVLFEYEKEIKQEEVTDRIIGLDYKSDGLYVDSEGNTCGSPKYYRKAQRRLARKQRQLARKQKNSKNREKAQQKLAKLHKHVANQRLDFLHKESTRITNLYEVVCIESLDMKAMSNKGFGNGKSTLDNGYGMFKTLLEYKLLDRGKYLVKVDKWYPSSQLCSQCGNRKKLDLSDRTYSCECGLTMDRDINAAINIKNEGLRILMSV